MESDTPGESEQKGFPSKLAGFDLATALSRLGGSESMFCTIAETFANSYASSAEKLTELFAAENYDEAYREAHGIKGVVGNIAADDLFEEARKLEAMAREASEGGAVPSAESVEAGLKAYRASLEVVLDSISRLKS